MSNTRRSSRRTTKSTNENNNDHFNNQDTSKGSDEWEVESVLSKQIKRDGSVHYLLKWKNYKGDPTWEPEHNCGCERLIFDFEDEVKQKQQELENMSVHSYDDSSTISNNSTKKKHTKSVTKSAEPTFSSFAKSKTTPKRRI